MRSITQVLVNGVFGLLILCPCFSVQAETKTTQNNGDLVQFDYFPRDPSESTKLSGGKLRNQRKPLSAKDKNKISMAMVNVDTILDNGNPADRIDIAVMGDGYTQDDIEKYQGQVSSFISQLFAISPFKEYKPFFNVHRIDVISAQSGITNDPTKGIKKDTALGTYFWCGGTQRAVCVDVNKVNAAALAAPGADQKPILINSNTWGGAAYPGLGIATISSGFPTLSAGIMAHELGHSLGLLADEYDYGGATTWTYGEPSAPNVSIRTATQMATSKLKWYRWLGFKDVNFDGLVSAYQGANYSRLGIYRPSYNSIMRNIGRPFNAPSVEAMIAEFYKQANPVQLNTSDSELLDGTGAVSIVVTNPTDHSLTISWQVDGKVITALAGSESVSLPSLALSSGLHKLSVIVQDKTSLVRNETLRSQYMTKTYNWMVIVGDASVAPTITSQPADASAWEGAKATFSVGASSSGTIKYQWLLNNRIIVGATSPSVSIAATKQNNGGKLRCVVSSSSGAVASSEATLTTLFPTVPTITTQPASVRVLEGQTSSMTVDATSTGPIKYQWQYYAAGKVFNVTGGSSATLTFSKAKLVSTNTWYRCVVSTTAGSVISNWALFVVLPANYYTPKYVSNLKNATIYQNTKIYFQVNAFNYGPFSYQWFQNGKAISGATSPQLILTMTKAMSGSKIQCAITNSYGVTRTNIANVTVK